jgi:hypothetical protein
MFRSVIVFSIKSAVAATALFVAMHSTAFAAEKCYEETVVPSSMSCSNNGSKSADFTSGCKFIPQTVEKKVVDCPATWVNSDGHTSQAAVCAAAGLTSATFDGQRCAAGERRPSTGENHENINYHSGKWGSGGGRGGSIVQPFSRTYTSGNRDNKQTTTVTGYYCWNSGDKRDGDGTDIAVAYVCKP